ncbi:hypothetical protein D5018_01105 [Parashewanella curva]|uniref:Uncharacterized protein n=1 Tax=Parashewanella curva TaxID=2338552 RepID=A0A3L8Q223_9GAMM|nr:hypothetical protein [Parashewanella curva]RLV61737.1 hypothetical protein D5018_01105 [Parashewanella curva]
MAPLSSLSMISAQAEFVGKATDIAKDKANEIAKVASLGVVLGAVGAASIPAAIVGGIYGGLEATGFHYFSQGVGWIVGRCVEQCVENRKLAEFFSNAATFGLGITYINTKVPTVVHTAAVIGSGVVTKALSDRISPPNKAFSVEKLVVDATCTLGSSYIAVKITDFSLDAFFSGEPLILELRKLGPCIRPTIKLNPKYLYENDGLVHCMPDHCNYTFFSGGQRQLYTIRIPNAHSQSTNPLTFVADSEMCFPYMMMEDINFYVKGGVCIDNIIVKSSKPRAEAMCKAIMGVSVFEGTSLNRGRFYAERKIDFWSNILFKDEAGFRSCSKIDGNFSVELLDSSMKYAQIKLLGESTAFVSDKSLSAGMLQLINAKANFSGLSGDGAEIFIDEDSLVEASGKALNGAVLYVKGTIIISGGACDDAIIYRAPSSTILIRKKDRNFRLFKTLSPSKLDEELSKSIEFKQSTEKI